MNRKTLTPSMLRTIVLQEMRKLRREGLSATKKQKTPEEMAKETEELTDAGDYADTLEKHVDLLKVLKVKENRLRAELRSINERRQKLIKKISG